MIPILVVVSKSNSCNIFGGNQDIDSVLIPVLARGAILIVITILIGMSISIVIAVAMLTTMFMGITILIVIIIVIVIMRRELERRNKAVESSVEDLQRQVMGLVFLRKTVKSSFAQAPSFVSTFSFSSILKICFGPSFCFYLLLL